MGMWSCWEMAVRTLVAFQVVFLHCCQPAIRFLRCSCSERVPLRR